MNRRPKPAGKDIGVLARQPQSLSDSAPPRLSATPSFNTYTNTAPLGDKAFYRVGLDLP